MRRFAEEFAPFLGFAPHTSEFEGYCDTVASPTAAEWGGQVELKAIAACFERQIYIYDSITPLLIMGEDFVDKKPLKVTYHRHYFSLGEHYNSVELLEESCSCANNTIPGGHHV